MPPFEGDSPGDPVLLELVLVVDVNGPVQALDDIDVEIDQLHPVGPTHLAHRFHRRTYTANVVVAGIVEARGPQRSAVMS